MRKTQSAPCAMLALIAPPAAESRAEICAAWKRHGPFMLAPN